MIEKLELLGTKAITTVVLGATAIGGGAYVYNSPEAQEQLGIKSTVETTEEANKEQNRNQMKEQHQNKEQKGKGEGEHKRGRKDENGKVDGKSLIEDMEKEDLSAAERDGLIKMREEEKLARDVYVALNKVWNQNIFTNISQAEQTHTDAIKALVAKYDLPDPMINDVAGEYKSEEIQKLYNDLVAQGSKSLVDAYKVGMTVEDLDIYDLNTLLAQTDNKDIKTVYQNLNKGSRNHMRAFYKNLTQEGGTYSAQFLSQAEIDSIIDAEQEKGRVDENGVASESSSSSNKTEKTNGQGNGQGRWNR